MSEPANSSRLFYAIPSCNDIREKFRIIKSQNRELAETRWIPEENHHITVFFLGEVISENISTLVRLMDVFLETTQDFELKFDQFSLEGGRPGHPSMLWARFEKNSGFINLSNKIGAEVSSLISVTPKFMEPVPHITLARIRSGPLPVININAECTIRFHGIELWKTIRHSSGVFYETVGVKYRE